MPRRIEIMVDRNYIAEVCDCGQTKGELGVITEHYCTRHQSGENIEIAFSVSFDNINNIVVLTPETCITLMMSGLTQRKDIPHGFNKFELMGWLDSLCDEEHVRFSIVEKW